MPLHSKIPPQTPTAQVWKNAASTGFEVKSPRRRLRLSNNDWTFL